MTRVNYREKFLKLIDSQYDNCSGIGKNPYTVNIITFSGHGINCNGDAIAVIPQFGENIDQTDPE